MFPKVLTKFLTRYYDIKVGSGAKAVKGSRVAVSTTIIAIMNGSLAFADLHLVCSMQIIHDTVSPSKCNNPWNRGMVTLRSLES
jgi:hypothetical protein